MIVGAVAHLLPLKSANAMNDTEQFIGDLPTKSGNSPTQLLQLLCKLQTRNSHISKEALHLLSERLQIPISEIVSTTNNNQAINEPIRKVANQYLDGHRLTEALLNQAEVAIRAYAPCLSCTTHAIGKMPMEIMLIDESGELIDRLEQGLTGQIERRTQ